MHEYSLAKELVNTLIEQVDDDTLTQTNTVHVEIGELRIISREALSSAYEIIITDTIVDGSRLEYENVQLKARCTSCGFEGPVDYDDEISAHFSVPVLSCPLCGNSVEVVQGNELAIRKLTVSDPNE